MQSLVPLGPGKFHVVVLVLISKSAAVFMALQVALCIAKLLN